MSRETGRGILAASFVACVLIIGWKQVKANPGKLPTPQSFVFAGLVYGLLGLLEPVLSPQLTSTFGAGVAIALSIRATNSHSADTNSPTSSPSVPGGEGFNNQ